MINIKTQDEANLTPAQGAFNYLVWWKFISSFREKERWKNRETNEYK